MGLLGKASFALVFAACTAADATAVTKFSRAETKTQFKFQIPDNWSVEQKERYALPAARIKAALIAGKRVDIYNTIITGPLNLYYADVAADVHIERCTIRGTANFSYAHFSRVVHLCETTFEGDADWTRAELAADLFLRGTVFAGTANFTDVKVGGSIRADPASSIAEPTTFGKGALFSRATVAASVFFPAARFGGSADYEGVRVGGQANFSGAVFKGEATFNGMEVGQSAFFEKTKFGRKVRFLGARIGRQANFPAAIFQAQVAFDGAQIEDQANFAGAKFLEAARFASTRFVSTAYFERTAFMRDALFEQAHFMGAAIFTRAEFGDAGNFAYSQFETETFLVRATFTGPVHFDNARMRTLTLAGEGQEPGIRSTIDLRGCTYDRLEPASQWKAVLDKQQPYDRQPYTQLEKTLREAGEDGIANKVYYQRKCLEARRIRFFPNPFAWGWDKFLRVVSGYGVRHIRLLIILVIILLVGTAWFCWPGAVVPERTPTASESVSEEASKQGSLQERRGRSSRESGGKRGNRRAIHRGLAYVGKAFWVSLAAFLPVGIPAGGQWEASSKVCLLFRFTAWATFLRIGGCIFWPVAIAALTGILKR